MSIKSIIIEDEQAARQALKSYLTKYCPQISLVGEAQNAKEGIDLVHKTQPQLLFLDVEMPFGNAFDVLEGCKNFHFETIFVTAFSEYSLRALNQSAAYYLLKPISIEELIVAVNKVQQHINKNQLFNRNQIIVQNIKEPAIEKQQVILPTLEGFEVVKMNDIIRLRGNGNFTDIYLKDQSKKMVCRFLKHFENMLPHPFLRVHRSHIINMNCIKTYLKSNGGSVILIDGSEVEISESYKSNFMEIMGS